MRHVVMLFVAIGCIASYATPSDAGPSGAAVEQPALRAAPKPDVVALANAIIKKLP